METDSLIRSLHLLENFVVASWQDSMISFDLIRNVFVAL